MQAVLVVKLLLTLTVVGEVMVEVPSLEKILLKWIAQHVMLQDGLLSLLWQLVWPAEFSFRFSILLGLSLDNICVSLA